MIGYLNFQDFVKSLPDNEMWGDLPLAHTTTMKFFGNILDKRAISTTKCSIFNQDLLYFFYGKPNYRSHKGDVNSTNTLWFPICILVKNAVINDKNIANIFPFDSGAFYQGRYKKFIDESSKLDEYRLPPDLCGVRKILNYFFDSIFSYFDGNPKKIDIEPFPLQIVDCYRLYNAEGDVDFDDRAKTIEISITENMNLDGGNIELMICPDTLREFIDRILGDEIPVSYYHVKKLAKAQDFYSVIEQLAYNYIGGKYREA